MDCSAVTTQQLPSHSLESDIPAQSLRCSHATHDLFNAISAGEYPEWDLQIQTMDPKDELNFDFDPLDATKVQQLPDSDLSIVLERLLIPEDMPAQYSGHT
jgi:Catalase